MPDPLPASPHGPVPSDPAQRFQLLGRVGAGNHGVVFRARDHQLHRDVAIKRFSHFLADDPRAMRRITREVAMLARVQHPHVVTVHDLVQMPDGDGEVTPHLVMELVDGLSLKDLLVKHGPSTRSTILVRKVLEGLAACHANDILHLDIKPANVLVTPAGSVKIVDFGIARAASDSTATLAGTPHYMAPEQYEGRADERSDIYSVGCLLYESLTGSAPFSGSMAAQLLAHRQQPRPDPRVLAPDVPPALAAVVERAMAIDPADRYAGVDDMLAALDAVDGPSASPPAAAAAPALEETQPVAAVRDSDETQPVAAVRDLDETQPVAAVPAAPSTSATAPELPGPLRRPTREPEPVAAPREAVVTRWSRLVSLGTGLTLSAFVVALLPGLVWATTAIPPAADHRPDVYSDANAGAWWLLAVAVAGVFLLLRRQDFLARLGGPAVGEPIPARLVGREMRSGIGMAASGALRGSIPMLFSWYAALVALLVAATEMPVPGDVLGTGWGIAWVLMPLATVALTVRALTKVRARFGSVVMSTLYLAGAALSAVLFVAYPFALG